MKKVIRLIGMFLTVVKVSASTIPVDQDPYLSDNIVSSVKNISISNINTNMNNIPREFSNLNNHNNDIIETFDNIEGYQNNNDFIKEGWGPSNLISAIAC